MIRALLAITVLIVLILVFYVPSTRDAQFYRERMQAESEMTSRLWGSVIASQIYEHTSDDRARSTMSLPIPSETDGPQFKNADQAVAREMNKVNERLFGNRYFQSIRELQALAGYRLYHLVYWLPWFTTFLLANLMDGGLTRGIRAKGLHPASPEIFGLTATTATLVACATVVALWLPLSNPPSLWASMMALVSVLAGQLVASFHPRSQ